MEQWNVTDNRDVTECKGTPECKIVPETAYRITPEDIGRYEEHLRREEYAENTILKYVHELERFRVWLEAGQVTKESITGWKRQLLDCGRAAVTVNASLAALHCFFEFRGWIDLRVKYLNIQRSVFRESSKELDRKEFERLVKCAKCKGDHRLALIMETICATGIRVSEVKYITVEALRRGRADIALKGKIRTILIPNKLARKLLKYTRKKKLVSGEIFLTARGKRISRCQIWRDMKSLCEDAGVEAEKVFPHNLRHLFARAFYKVNKDIVRLADVLGHSSIETTRIYLVTTGKEYARELDRLGFVS